MQEGPSRNNPRDEMAYQVLARKWRPQNFSDVVGQEHVTQTLVNAIRADRLAHAYLFAGPRGVGKTSVARILAKAINCEEGEPGKPCNQCLSCTEITSGSSVDVQEIDGASNRGIDEIRELRGNINYLPSSSKYRVYIIDEVHMLTLPAFNALLKTLEEPPPHVKFIFATTEPHKVPVTILSRCQRFDFKRIPIHDIVHHLDNIAREEGVHISNTALSLIAREAEGGMRDAESLLDQVVSFAGMTVEDAQVTDILGIIDRELLFQISASIIEGDMKACLQMVDGIYNHGHDMKAFYRNLMQQFRDLLVSLISPENSLMELPEGDRERARQQAEKAGRERLQIILNFLINH
jgi:DNA polymerase III subunit gamma/tau